MELYRCDGLRMVSGDTGENSGSLDEPQMDSGLGCACKQNGIGAENDERYTTPTPKGIEAALIGNIPKPDAVIIVRITAAGK